jgi:hypothetical protein
MIKGWQAGVNEKTAAWWNSLDLGQRLLARAEARRYESLSEEERDAVWNEEAESIDAEAESDQRTGAIQ